MLPVCVSRVGRQKALAVEKYRSTNPTANAVVYTYMTNCCCRQGMWEVAYDGELSCLAPRFGEQPKTRMQPTTNNTPW